MLRRNNAARIQQTLTGLNFGVTYRITGDFASIWHQYGNRNASSFAVLVNGVPVFTASRAAVADGTYRSFTAYFTATSDTVTAALLLLQGAAELIRCVRTIRAGAR